EHETRGEERIRRERLRVIQTGVEQKECVDAPDKRSSQRVEQQQEQIDALALLRRSRHYLAVAPAPCSMSTAMFRHLPCRNRHTLSTARVRWPSTIASQMSVGRRPRVACSTEHSPIGTPI